MLVKDLMNTNLITAVAILTLAEGGNGGEDVGILRAVLALDGLTDGICLAHGLVVVLYCCGVGLTLGKCLGLVDVCDSLHNSLAVIYELPPLG